ncbi:MAG: hypothetical protein JWN30_573 [Bacilli bacterium]|nr:hypothetical protein [Bacilli bacterium]
MFASIRWKLVLIYLLLILFAMQLIGMYFVQSLNEYFLTNFNSTLYSTSNLLATHVEPYLSSKDSAQDNNPQELQQFLNTFAQMSGGGIYVLDKNGTILAASNDPLTIGEKRNSTEITQALSGTRGSAIRQDPQNHHLSTYLAVPVRDGSQVAGVVYLIAPMTQIYESISHINLLFYTGIVISLVLSGILGIVLARTITNPILEITRKASAMAKGDFSQQVTVKSSDEIGQLGQTFNTLSARLRSALEQNDREKSRIEAILLHMSDGVVAMSAADNFFLVNPVAQQFLGVKQETELMDKLHAVIPANVQEQLWNGAAGEFTLEGAGGRMLRVYSSPIHEEQSQIGRVLVLRDITEEEREQRDRRDFVANVSHEIRTPLTTIKSYIEALEDGAVEELPTAKRFLQVLHSETDRMVRLVSDLLQLSRLDARNVAMRMTAVSCRQMLNDVIERFGVLCERHQITLSTQLEPGLPLLLADVDQLNQVWDNLMSNALKYTAENGTIRISVARHGANRVAVSVQDSGVGIPEQDLPRIFERFYRVDKARSRKLGGTGLGLSIVQQIIEAHGGTISVDSEIDRGTIVTFSLRTVEGSAR